MRVIDTGLKSAAENIAWDRALMQARREDAIEDTIRFLRFKPSALVGFHQSVEQEIRIDYCRANGIEINRRVTGGGAIYFDEGQLGWEIVFKRSSLAGMGGMEDVSAEICRVAASALRECGVDAQFRPRNDIEVNGRKISGTGGAFERDTVLFQGTLLIDFNLEHLIKALRIPVEKLSDKELLSARKRVVSMNEILGVPADPEKIKESLAASLAGLFGRTPFFSQDVTAREAMLAEKYYKEVSSDEWIDPESRRFGGSVELIKTVSKSKGGLLRVSARVDREKRLLKQILITGDVLISPARLIYDLEAALKETPFAKVTQQVEKFFEQTGFDSVAVTADDFKTVVDKLMDKVSNYDNGFSSGDLNSIETLGGGLKDVSAQSELLLLPYCAKPVDCEYRNEDNCDECGKCTIGDAYALARESGMRARCINNYEELMSVFEEEREKGVKTFIGACCGAFFTKRHRAFVESQMSCAIVDIDDTTCYELHKEELAYKGQFQRQTRLKLDTLEKVISLHRAKRVGSS